MIMSSSLHVRIRSLHVRKRVGDALTLFNIAIPSHFPSSSRLKKMAQVPEELDAAELKLGGVFSGAKCLMNSEVAMMLEKKHQQLKVAFNDPSVQVSEVFKSCLEYAKPFGQKQSTEDADQVREVFSRHGLSAFELCTIGNLLPDDSEEAKTLVPSLKRFPDYEIEHMLAELPA